MTRRDDDLEKIRQEILDRARVIPRPSAADVERAKRRAKQFGQFLERKMKEKKLTRSEVADSVGIELDFINTLFGGQFPLSELGPDMLDSLAKALGCSRTDVINAFNGNDNR